MFLDKSFKILHAILHYYCRQDAVIAGAGAALDDSDDDDYWSNKEYEEVEFVVATMMISIR